MNEKLGYSLDEIEMWLKCQARANKSHDYKVAFLNEYKKDPRAAVRKLENAPNHPLLEPFKFLGLAKLANIESLSKEKRQELASFWQERRGLGK